MILILTKVDGSALPMAQFRNVRPASTVKAVITFILMLCLCNVEVYTVSRGFCV